MSDTFGPDPEEWGPQDEAHRLLLRVALALVDDARGVGAFETDEQKLAARAAELADEFDGRAPGGSQANQALVLATPLTADRISLSAPFGESSSAEATLRIDGVFLEESTATMVAAEPVDEAELSPEEAKELRQSVAEYEARMARPRFSGRRFLRALAVQPQPGSEVQVLAAELFDDGLLVHFTFDQEPQSLEQIMGDLSAWPDTEPELRIEDDLGTEYFPSDGGGGGVQVVHRALGFAPAVPTAARALQVTTRSGTVELPL